MATGYGGYPPAGDSGFGGVVRQLGDRVWRRAEPRVGISLAGVGVLMVIFGLVVWATDHAVTNAGDTGDPDTTLGIVLSALVVAGGYALLLRFKTGPLATAGVAAIVLAVPVTLLYVTFDPVQEDQVIIEDGSSEDVIFDEDGDVVEDGFDDELSAVYELPFNVHLVALGSIAAWMLSFLLVPPAKGRLFFLGASLFFAWLWLLELVEEGAIAWVLGLPFGTFFFPFYALADEFGAEPEIPDPTSIGGLSLMVGLAYYAVGYALDRSERHGMATPFTVAGLVTLVLGLGHLAGDLEAIGVGIMLVILGSLLAVYGATQGRRFTTWAWAFGIGLGVVVIVGDAFEENTAGWGISSMILGAGVIVLGWWITRQFSEPDEMEPGSSSFTPRRPSPAVATFGGPGYPGAPGAPWTGTGTPGQGYPQSGQFPPQTPPSAPPGPPTGPHPGQPPTPPPGTPPTGPPS